MCVNLLSSIALALALLVAPAQQAFAQGADQKPALVVSLTNINEQLADISYLLRATGQDQIVPLLEIFVPAYADGLDKRQPIGVLVDIEMGEPVVTGFIPVEDLGKVLGKIEAQTGEAEDVGGGIQRITSPQGQDIFIKESKGWAFLSNMQEKLGAVPDDPSKALGKLADDYNIAIQVNPRSIPEELRQMAIDTMKEGFADGLGDVEGADLATSIESIEQMINELEQLTIGWNIDAMGRTTYLDFEMVAVEGTKLAKSMADMQGVRSKFAGFLMQDAAMNFNMASVLTEQDRAALVTGIDQGLEELMEKLEEDEDLDEASRTNLTDLANTISGALKKTIEAGKVDGGASLLIDGKKVAVVAGGLITEGEKVSESVRKTIELGKERPEFKGTAELDAATYANTSFHKITMPVPDDKDEARDILGENLEVYVGIGEDRFYVAVGQDSLSKLKQAIDASADGGGMNPPLGQMTIALLPILKFAAEFPEGGFLGSIVDELEDMMGKDKIRISSHAIERGGKSRIELEEGALKGIGAGIQAVMENRGGGGFDDF